MRRLKSKGKTASCACDTGNKIHAETRYGLNCRIPCHIEIVTGKRLATRYAVRKFIDEIATRYAVTKFIEEVATRYAVRSD